MFRIKLAIACVILSLFCLKVNAQNQSVIKWVYSSKKISQGLYEIHITGMIKDGWHTYSQTTAAGGPIPTTITFSKNPLVTLVDVTNEVGKLEQHYEKLFGVDVKQYSNRVEFIQRITLKKPVKTSISGTIEYMTCNDRECLPPRTEKFSVSLN